MGLLNGTLRDYHRDPVPHSLLRIRESTLDCGQHAWLDLRFRVYGSGCLLMGPYSKDSTNRALCARVLHRLGLTGCSGLRFRQD